MARKPIDDAVEDSPEALTDDASAVGAVDDVAGAPEGGAAGGDVADADGDAAVVADDAVDGDACGTTETGDAVDGDAEDVAEANAAESPTAEDRTELLDTDEDPTVLIEADSDDYPVASEDPTALLDSADEAVAAELAEDREEAFDSLYRGNYVQDARPTEMLPPIGRSAHPVTPVVYAPSEPVSKTIRRNQGHFRHGVAAAIISILLIFGLGLGAGVYYRHLESERETAELIAENEKRAAEEAERQRIAAEEAEAAQALEAMRAPRPVKFLISALEYNADATRIPLVVTGIDFEGNEVNIEAFVNSAGEGLALAPGDYTATIPASPILPNGSIYTVPTNTYTFKVTGEDESVTVDQAIVLIPLAADKTTEDMVNNACTWALKDEGNPGVAEANSAVARQMVEEAKARQQREAQAKQTQEQRASLAQAFAEAFFTNIGFPDSNDDSKVLLINNWSEIASQYVAPGSSAQSKLAAGPDPEDKYIFATKVSATGVSGDTVSVDCQLVSTSDPKKGWTKNVYPALMRCTFNENNKITSFTIE